MIELDGSFAEGGGQIVRTALALSVITGKAFSAGRIRSGRPQPGLKTQHLQAVKVLQELTDARVEGCAIGSPELKFAPGIFRPKSITVDIGTAGSITLLLQALLPPMLFCGQPVTLRLKGGTDVKWSMPIDYFTYVLVPNLRRYADLEVELERRGYYPEGSGSVKIRVKPRFSSFQEDFYSRLENEKIFMLKRGPLAGISGISHASKALMKQEVSERQMRAARFILGQVACEKKISVEYCDAASIGSGITLWAQFEKEDEYSAGSLPIMGADGLGEKGIRSEIVGQEAAKALLREIDSGAPVDSHLADQLLLFMALAPGSRIWVSEVTRHCEACIYVIEKFLPVRFSMEKNVISVSKNV